MRLVDADAIENELGVEDRDLYVQHILDFAPTVDAEPVKHRQWIWDKENDKMYCSECGYETDNWGVHQESDPIEWQLPNYCENCGAKMDGVK